MLHLLDFLVPLLRQGFLLFSDLTHATDKKLKGACEDIGSLLQGVSHFEALEATELNIKYTRKKSRITIHTFLYKDFEMQNHLFKLADKL